MAGDKQSLIIEKKNDKVGDEVQERLKTVLDDALKDGTITTEQYQRLLAKSAVEGERAEEHGFQRVLISSGIVVLVTMVVLTFLFEAQDVDYYLILSILGILDLAILIGGAFALKMGYEMLHCGLVSGFSILFALSYGFWFYYTRELSQWSNEFYTVSADRNILLAIPLILIPFVALCYLIYRNSRLGAQGCLFSLLIVGWIIAQRATSWSSELIEPDSAYIYVGIIGVSAIAALLSINVLWWRGRLSGLKDRYNRRSRTFNSLLSSGYVLFSFYVMFFFEVVDDRPGEILLTVGGICSLLLAFSVIAYVFLTKKKRQGLMLSACAMIVFSTWIIGLSRIEEGGVLCLLSLGIITFFILTFMAYFLKWRQIKKSSPPSSPTPPKPQLPQK
jgi:hypothetical protein